MYSILPPSSVASLRVAMTVPPFTSFFFFLLTWAVVLQEQRRIEDIAG